MVVDEISILTYCWTRAYLETNGLKPLPGADILLRIGAKPKSQTTLRRVGATHDRVNAGQTMYTPALVINMTR